MALAVGLGVIALVGLGARLGADIPPTVDGEDLSLLVELRCPRGVEPEHSQETDHTGVPGDGTRQQQSTRPDGVRDSALAIGQAGGRTMDDPLRSICAHERGNARRFEGQFDQ